MAKKTAKPIMTEQDKLYFLKMILSKMSLDMAMNMIRDLNDEEKRSPALYNSCIKFLEQNEITFDKIATAKDDDDALKAILIDVENDYQTMLIDYDTFGEG